MSLLSHTLIHFILCIISKSITIDSSHTSANGTLLSIETEVISLDNVFDPITLRLYADEEFLECIIPITHGITSYECDVSDDSLVRSDCLESDEAHLSSTANSTFVVTIHNPNQHGIAINAISMTDASEFIFNIDSFCHQTSLHLNGKMGINPTGWQCRDYRGANEYDAICIDSERNDYLNCAQGTNTVAVRFNDFSDEGLVFPLDSLHPINCSTDSSLNPSPDLSAVPSSTEWIISGTPSTSESTESTESTESAQSVESTESTGSNGAVHEQNPVNPSTTKTWSIVQPDYEETSHPIKSGLTDNFMGNNTLIFVIWAAILALILMFVYFMYNKRKRKKETEVRERVIVVVDQNNIIPHHQMDGDYGMDGESHRGRGKVMNALRNVSSLSPMGVSGEVMTDGRGIYTVPNNAAFDDDIDTLDMDIPSDNGLLPEVDTAVTEGDDGETETEALMDGNYRTEDDSDAQSADDRGSAVRDEDICTAMPNVDTPGDC